MAWSTTYGAGDDPHTIDAITPYMDAHEERANAVVATVGGTGGGTGSLRLPDPVEGGFSIPYWMGVTGTLIALGTQFLTPDSAAGIDGAYNGGTDFGFDLNPIDEDPWVPYFLLRRPGVTEGQPFFPMPDGRRRLVERVIHSFAAGGSDGDRARFLVGAGGGNAPDTPPAEQRWGGRVFRRQAGAWVEEPGADPDIVETFGAPRDGDVFAGHLMADARDAANQMRHTLMRTTANRYVLGRQAADGGGRFEYETLAEAEAACAAGLAVGPDLGGGNNFTFALQAYRSGGVQRGVRVYAGRQSDGSDLLRYGVEAHVSRHRVDVFTFWDTGGLSCQITFYAAGSYVAAPGVLADPGYVAAVAYDPMGSGVQRLRWSEIGTVDATPDGTDIEGPYVGPAGAELPEPGADLPAVPPGNGERVVIGYRGWGYPVWAAVADWDFEYSGP